MQLLKKILFPTDFGESMGLALESAIGIAKKFDSELILLHVLPENSTNVRLKWLVSEKMDEFIRQVKEQGVNCYYELIPGNSIEIISVTAKKKKVDLILLGAGKSRTLDSKLGVHSEEIIRNVTMPVWVIEKGKQLTINNILCPVDFSKESKIALDNAIHLCRRFEAKLMILHVVKSQGEEYAKFDINLTAKDADTMEAVSVDFENFLIDVNLSGVSWQKELLLGDPSDEIIKTINDNKIDLLVMGSTGKSELKQFFVGSVTQKVSRKVPCSFVISKSTYLVHLQLNNNLDDIDAIFEEGVQLVKDGYTKEAIDEWKKCTAINELYLKAWGAIASTYESMDKLEDAKIYNEAKNRIQKSIWDQQIEADLRDNHSLFN